MSTLAPFRPLSRRPVRAITLILALLMLVSTVANVPPAEASTRDVVTRVHCFPQEGEVLFRTTMWGDYNGQWGATRWHVHRWTGNSWQNAWSTDWLVRQTLDGRTAGPHTYRPDYGSLASTHNINYRAFPTGFYRVRSEHLWWSGSRWESHTEIEATYLQYFQGQSTQQRYCTM